MEFTAKLIFTFGGITGCFIGGVIGYYIGKWRR